jgi:acyl dehydratase
MNAPAAPIRSADDAVARAGSRLGPTEWLEVTQEMVAEFGRLTGDMQWIHVDPVRAAAGPFGRCIAHGLLTSSLAGGRFFHDLVRTTARNGVNYGSDRVRYPAPVPVGSRVRGNAEIASVQRLEGDTVQMTVRVTVEIEGAPRPGCVADFVVRYQF